MNQQMLRNAIRILKTGNGSSVLCRRTEYTSDISLRNLYPTSSLKITTPLESKINEKSKEKFSGYIPIDKLEIKTSKSSGPGGQHLQATQTKVEIRFHLESADWIPEEIRNKLLEVKKNQLNHEGYLILRSDKTRSQHMNLADVLQRLRTIIYDNTEIEKPPPSPETLEMIRKRKEKANRERLFMKARRSILKQERKNSEY